MINKSVKFYIIGCILLLLPTFFFIKMRDHDPSQYQETGRILLFINETDSRLNEEILLIRSGQVGNYDNLVNIILEMKKRLKHLKNAAQKISDKASPQFLNDAETLSDVFLKKESRIEKFKTTYALYRNSSDYILHSGDYIIKSLIISASTSLKYRKLADDFRTMFYSILIFNITGDTKFKSQISDDMKMLSDYMQQEGINPDSSTFSYNELNFKIFGNHVSMVISNRDILENYVNDIINFPIKTVIANMEAKIIKKQGDAGRLSGIFRNWLYALSLTFILYIVYMILRLKRSAGELNKLNEKLKEEIKIRIKTEADLKEAQIQLVNKAMETGRTELAAVVLHNIGNALTPIKIYLDDMKGNEETMISVYLDKCYLELQAYFKKNRVFPENENREKAVFNYMGELLNSQSSQFKKRGETIKKIASAFSYVLETMLLQQSYAVKDKNFKEKASLSALLNDAVEIQSGAIMKRGITVVKNLGENLPEIIIDKNRLMQVLLNLIKNAYEAIDAIAEEQPETIKKISIRTFVENGGVGFSISDSGIGIASGEADSLFEFGISQKGSSGIGLYYSKQFIEANNGFLGLESEGKGRGAKVTAIFIQA